MRDAKKTTLCVLLTSIAAAAAAADFAALVSDRTALERVYYNHRIGNKPPFEQVLPPAAIEKAVRADLKKEFALKRAYKTEITNAQVAAEVKRIDTSTRAPEMLAEIKTALGNDSARFARAVARPIAVERELHTRFENDDKLHAAERREGEEFREKLRAEKNASKALALMKSAKADDLTETTWQLNARPQSDALAQRYSAPASQTKVVASSGPYSVEAAARIAQVLSPPAPERGKFYFEDLAPELQRVLRAQMQKAGDVSALIETPRAFLIYICEEKSAEVLRTACLTIPKRSYDDWLAKQSD